MIAMEKDKTLCKIRWILSIFIIVLFLSGITAFPLIKEIDILNKIVGNGTWMEQVFPAMAHWISYVHDSLIAINSSHPFIFYGTDWLAFGHIVISIFFIGALRHPVRNIWVVEAGIIACILVIPTSLICGPIRGIPPFWILVDCSFACGALPLILCRKYIKQLEEETR